MRWETGLLPEIGVMMLLWGITIYCRAIEDVLFVVERTCIIFYKWEGSSTTGPFISEAFVFI